MSYLKTTRGAAGVWLWLCIFSSFQVFPSFISSTWMTGFQPRGFPRGFQGAIRCALPLQKAIDELPSGAILRLPPGRYENAEPIILRRNITLEGVQPAMEDIKTQLESSIIFEEGSEEAVLRHLEILNHRRFAAVHLRCSGSPKISRCNISSCGVGILADAPLHRLSTPLISDCRVGPAWQGLVIAGRCRGTFDRCVISGCRSCGIRVRNDATPLLRENLVIGCTGPGMVVWNRGKPEMEENVFLDNGEEDEDVEATSTTSK